jgi:tripartite-type tricarboxylate transporter receptor subunit TctC
MRARLATLGVDPVDMTRAAFGAYVEEQFAINAALVKAIGLKPE